MNFKVGDKVKLTKLEGALDGFAEGDICKINATTSFGFYQIEIERNDGTVGFTKEECLEPVNKKPTKEELLKMPIGTKIITDLEEHNVFIKTCEDEFVNDYNSMYDTDIEENLSINDEDYGTKIIKIEVPTYETIYESSKEVKEMTVAEISKALGYVVKIKMED